MVDGGRGGGCQPAAIFQPAAFLAGGGWTPSPPRVVKKGPVISVEAAAQPVRALGLGSYGRGFEQITSTVFGPFYHHSNG